MENLEIKFIDKDKPIGKLVYDYARIQWWNGFRTGCLVGMSYCSFLFLIRLYRERMYM
jgi:hypothetical protein